QSTEKGAVTVKNPWLAEGGRALEKLLFAPEDVRSFDRPTSSWFPSGLARAPFRWKYLDQLYDMEFVAGFVGVRQDAANMSVRPEIGWAVLDGAGRKATVAARIRERGAEVQQATRRAQERAQQWTRRGMCPRCEFWRYLQEGDAAVCCGGALVNLEQREHAGQRNR